MKPVRKAGEDPVIAKQRRGEPVTGLRPQSAPPRLPAAKRVAIFAELRKFWARTPQMEDSARFVEEDRDR